MFKDLRQLYCMVICFISAVVLMVTLIVSVNAITELIIPEYKHKSSLLKYQSNDNYLRHNQTISDNTKKHYSMLPKEVEALRISERDDYIGTIKGDAISTLISCINTFIVSLIFFIAHWNLYSRSSKQKVVTD